MFSSEERRVAERIKEYIKKEGFIYNEVKIMLRNGRILRVVDYSDMLSAGKIKPQDAYVYIRIGWISYGSSFYYPSLVWYGDFLDAYLSKLGFDYRLIVVPATGLKYVAFVLRYGDCLTVELVNLDTAVNNTNLRTIAFEVLGAKLVSGERELTDEEHGKILDMFKSQRLIVGYDFDGALDIIHNYYENGNQSLAKEVARITMDYDRIFHPYRVCYDMNSWKEVDCW